MVPGDVHLRLSHQFNSNLTFFEIHPGGFSLLIFGYLPSPEEVAPPGTASSLSHLSLPTEAVIYEQFA